ncbi:MAG: HupE/UreJ family protein [Methylococcales bacterium]|nr:HupE/UreJ family protein [Methylococcales bacterium]
MQTCFGKVCSVRFLGRSQRAFIAVLREMGISSLETGILVPLFSFNLGVELGQITVATIVLPIIWWLHKKPAIEPYLTPVCSVLASLAGAYWLIERTLLS